MTNEENLTSSMEILTAVTEAWKNSSDNQFIKSLNSGDDLQAVIESVPDIGKYFEKPLDEIDCSDGRVRETGQIGIAGSGVLLDEYTRQKFVAKYRGQIKKVTAHHDCGAANIKYQALEAASNLPEGVSNPDDLGVHLAQEFARDLGAAYEYVPEENLANDFHNERLIMVDGTGCLNSNMIPDLPAHFVSSGFGFDLPAEYLENELKILSGIALGHHGFGDRFTAENPFYLVVAATDALQLEKIIKVAQEATNDFGDRVVVRGFIQPGPDKAN